MKIKQTIIVGALLVMAIIGIFAIPTAYAADCGGKVLKSGESCCGGVVTSIVSCKELGWGSLEDTGLWGVVLLSFSILSAGVGIVAVGGVVYGSVIYTTAGGNLEQTKKARAIIASTVIGIIMYALLYSFLNFLIPGGLFATNPPKSKTIISKSTFIDTTPPTTPKNLSSQGYGGYTKLSWDSSTDNVGVIGYFIERSIDSSSGTSTTWVNIGNVSNFSKLEFRDTSIFNSTIQYNYRVKAFDAAGNVSLPSNVVAGLVIAKPKIITPPKPTTPPKPKTPPKPTTPPPIVNPNIVKNLKPGSVRVLVIGNQFASTSEFKTTLSDVQSALTLAEPYKSNKSAYDFVSYSSSANEFKCIMEPPPRSTSGPLVQCNNSLVTAYRSKYGADLVLLIDNKVSYKYPNGTVSSGGAGYPTLGIATVTRLSLSPSPKHLVLHEFTHIFALLNDEYLYYDSTPGSTTNTIPNKTDDGKFSNRTCYAGRKTGWTTSCLYYNWSRETSINIMAKYGSFVFSPTQFNLVKEAFQKYSK
ncbi:MAG: hypothetical protein WCK26_00160 [Candidatus Saccharibacteria bacterium]